VINDIQLSSFRAVSMKNQTTEESGCPSSMTIIARMSQSDMGQHGGKWSNSAVSLYSSSRFNLHRLHSHGMTDFIIYFHIADE